VATAIKVDFSQLRQSIEVKQRALSDASIKARLVQAAEVYRSLLRADIRSKVSFRATGQLERALCTIVQPWRVDKGWAVGVGDIGLVGQPGDAPASRTTIREFWDWFNEALEKGDTEAVQAHAERLRARVTRRAQAARERGRARAKPAAAPARAKAPEDVLARLAREVRERQARRDALDAEMQGIADRVAARVAEARVGRAFEAGRATVTRLRQEISDLRATRDVQVASVQDTKTKSSLRAAFQRRIEERRWQLTRAIATLRQQRDMGN